jgi:hypothetical protein
MARARHPQILIASDLLDGDVVFLGAQGFERDQRRARVAATPSEAAALLEAGQAAVAANRVVDVSLVDVAIDEEAGPVPLHYRERLRTKGPSVRPDLGKQASAAGSKRWA